MIAIWKRIHGKIDTWFRQIGDVNLPMPHDYDQFAEEQGLITYSDRIGDEKGDFDVNL